MKYNRYNIVCLLCFCLALKTVAQNSQKFYLVKYVSPYSSSIININYLDFEKTFDDEYKTICLDGGTKTFAILDSLIKSTIIEENTRQHYSLDSRIIIDYFENGCYKSRYCITFSLIEFNNHLYENRSVCSEIYKIIENYDHNLYTQKFILTKLK